MPSTILSDNGVSSGTSGIKTTGSNDGALALQTTTAGGTATTALSIDTSQSVSFVNNITVNGLVIGRGTGSVSTNTALGTDALVANTTGANNTAVGYQALDLNTTGVQNTAFGSIALGANTTANGNTGLGMAALKSTTTGSYNTAVGDYAMEDNTTGQYNTAIGGTALANNTTASNNTAVGYQALYTNTTGARSTAVGLQAGYSVATNDAVTAVGYFAGFSNTGGFSAFFGRNAGYLSTAAKGTMIGDGAGSEITTGTGNTILGRYIGNQDGLDIRTASNYAVISDGDGNRLLSMYNGGTLALDGGAVPQSGTGITFPATQSASSDANTLDDYEEGTFTPSVTFGGGSTGITYGNERNGTYVKIGRFVFASINITLTNKGSSSGSVQITGLPFTVSNSVSYGIQPVNTFSLNSTIQTLLQITTGGTAMDIKSGGTDTNISNTDFTNSTQIRTSFVYQAA